MARFIREILRKLFRPELESAIARLVRRAVIVGSAAFLGEMVSGVEALGLDGTEKLVAVIVVAALLGLADKLPRINR